MTNTHDDDDPIDLDALERFIDEHPYDSPEAHLEDVIEDETTEFALFREALTILETWNHAAAAGHPVPLERKRFESEAFFTKHGYMGADGFPLPHQRPQTRN